MWGKFNLFMSNLALCVSASSKQVLSALIYIEFAGNNRKYFTIAHILAGNVWLFAQLQRIHMRLDYKYGTTHTH